MQDTVRIGAAALGGYVLGRTKKAKTAITLALWLSGKGRPSDMARTQAVKALQSDKGQELLGQLRGPVMAAGKQAALSVFEARAGQLSDSLSRRTDLLTESGGNGSGSKGKRSRRTSGEDDEDELSERRQRPSDRKPDSKRRPPRSRDVESADDEDEDEYEDEYEDEAEDGEDEAGEDEAGEESDEDEDDERGYEDEYEDEEEDEEEEEDEDEADEYEDEADEYEDEDEDEDEDEYEADDEYEDEEPTRRRRAS